jgi:DME family drug/metabolite transporter
MDISARLSSRAGVFAISGGAALWGTTGVVVHDLHAATGLSAVTVGCYRLLVAAAVLVALRGPDLVRLARASGRRRGVALVLTGAGFGIYQALYFVGVADAGVSLATLVSIGTAPVVLTVSAAVTRRRLPSAGAFATLLCAVGGLALVSSSTSSLPGPHPVTGALAGSADPLTLTGATCLIGGLTLLPVALVSGLGFAVDGPAMPALLYLGVLPTAVAYGLFFGGLRSTTTEVAAVLTLIEPLAATLLAAALLGETLTLPAAVGAALLLVAVSGLYLRPVDPG